MKSLSCNKFVVPLCPRCQYPQKQSFLFFLLHILFMNFFYVHGFPSLFMGYQISLSFWLLYMILLLASCDPFLCFTVFPHFLLSFSFVMFHFQQSLFSSFKLIKPFKPPSGVAAAFQVVSSAGVQDCLIESGSLHLLRFVHCFLAYTGRWVLLIFFLSDDAIVLLLQ